MDTVVQVSRKLLLILCLLIICPRGQAQRLVYALSFAQTPGSLRARFPNGVLGASVQDRLAMLRQCRKTEIYSVSMIDGKRSMLFSDEGLNFEITPVGSVSGEGRAYLRGIEREWRTGPVPGVYADPVAVYEISLDGSRQFRRLLEVQPNQSAAVVNPQHSKAAFQNFVDGKYVISIYDLPAWKLLHKLDLTKILQTHCASCNLLSFGWLADGERLFLNVVQGDEDDGDPHPTSVPGIYIASEEGKDLGKLTADIRHFSLPGYVHPNFDYLLGQLADGKLVFQGHAVKQGRPADMQCFVVVSDSASGTQKPHPKKCVAGTYQLSPSGKYLAYIEERPTPDYRPQFYLWSEELETGQQTELFVTPAPNPPTSIEPNVTLTLLGWIGE